MLSIQTKDVALSFIRTTPSSVDKSCFRRLSREFPMSEASFEEYYFRDGSVGIPFLWESQPGTPKIKSRESPLPPLTPPPSYLSSSTKYTRPTKKHVKSNNLIAIPKLNLKKSQVQDSPSGWSSSSSLQSPNESRQRFSSPRMSIHSRFGVEVSKEQDDYDDCEPSHVSPLCFPAGRRGNANGRRRGCSSGIVKLLLREFSS